ncbi:MAG: hypothetical protein ACYTXF_33270 [Nostoc sp.]
MNQHWGYDYPANDINNASTGCLVGRSRGTSRVYDSNKTQSPLQRLPAATFSTPRLSQVMIYSKASSKKQKLPASQSLGNQLTALGNSQSF